MQTNACMHERVHAYARRRACARGCECVARRLHSLASAYVDAARLDGERGCMLGGGLLARTQPLKQQPQRQLVTLRTEDVRDRLVERSAALARVERHEVQRGRSGRAPREGYVVIGGRRGAQLLEQRAQLVGARIVGCQAELDAVVRRQLQAAQGCRHRHVRLRHCTQRREQAKARAETRATLVQREACPLRADPVRRRQEERSRRTREATVSDSNDWHGRLPQREPGRRLAPKQCSPIVVTQRRKQRCVVHAARSSCIVQREQERRCCTGVCDEQRRLDLVEAAEHVRATHTQLGEERRASNRRPNQQAHSRGRCSRHRSRRGAWKFRM